MCRFSMRCNNRKLTTRNAMCTNLKSVYTPRARGCTFHRYACPANGVRARPCTAFAAHKKRDRSEKDLARERISIYGHVCNVARVTRAPSASKKMISNCSGLTFGATLAGTRHICVPCTCVGTVITGVVPYHGICERADGIANDCVRKSRVIHTSVMPSDGCIARTRCGRTIFLISPPAHHHVHHHLESTLK